MNEDDHTFVFSFFTTENLIDMVKKIENKNSRDLDGISNNFLKQIICEIAEPLTHVLNLSLKTGVIPHQLKRAKVVPIFKLNKSANNEHLNPLFYRPISLLPIFSKILEKKEADSLVKYLDDFNLIYKQQYGYCKKMSTFHPMIHLMNKVTSALNNGDIAVGVFCDLQKLLTLVNILYLYRSLKSTKSLKLN